MPSLVAERKRSTIIADLRMAAIKVTVTKKATAAIASGRLVREVVFVGATVVGNAASQVDTAGGSTCSLRWWAFSRET
jgi:hypothetical protein